MPARTIDEVLEHLDEIIEGARREKSRLCYFAALYRNVTIKVKEDILAGSFEDGARMERLDVAFANRYFDALEGYHRAEELSKCWRTTFRAAQNWHPIVLQHLLLGINAHINLDLGIAAAQTSPGTQLAGLRRDFDAINNILWAMLDDVHQYPPGISIRLAKFFVRLTESRDVRKIIDILASSTASGGANLTS